MVELRRAADGWECSLDGASQPLDVAEVAPGVLSLLLDGQSFTLHVVRHGDGWRVHTRGTDVTASVRDPRRWQGRTGGAAADAGPQEVSAPMPGKVVRVLVSEQEEVEAGQGLVVVEAMKMQNEIPSPKKGVIEQVRVREGDRVEHGAVLVVVG
ncbi:MAG: biotin/lipoyl-containing protein [Candidatus Acidiferrales bacterium]